LGAEFKERVNGSSNSVLADRSPSVYNAALYRYLSNLTANLRCKGSSLNLVDSPSCRSGGIAEFFNYEKGVNKKMFSYPIPDPQARRAVENEARAEVNLCWTCSTCDSECPIFRATRRLRPQRIVRMANLGFLDELLSLRRALLSWEKLSQYRDLVSRFQRVRWHTAEQCQTGEMILLSTDLWRQWLDTPIEPLKEEIAFGKSSLSEGFMNAAGRSQTIACFN